MRINELDNVFKNVKNQYLYSEVYYSLVLVCF